MNEPTKEQIKGIQIITIRWQCSGCDHLCALLTDETIKPDDIILCPYAKDKWRKVV